MGGEMTGEGVGSRLRGNDKGLSRERRIRDSRLRGNLDHGGRRPSLSALASPAHAGISPPYPLPRHPQEHPRIPALPRFDEIREITRP